jgi:hypothetical protein
MKKPTALCVITSILVLLGYDTPGAVAVAEESSVTFQAQRQPGRTDHITVLLEAGGETSFTTQGKSKREKMSVRCDLDYFEKTVEAPADTACSSIRDYQKVSADVKVGDGQFKPTLQPQHHLIAVDASRQTALLFSPGGSLTRDELDAIDVPANSLLLDRLLPDGPVAVGDRWPHAADLLAALLGLDDVAKNTVQSTLKEVTDRVARFEFAGRVEGTIYGVSTVIELKGRYRFDLRTKRIDWLGMLAKEERPSSFVADGVDAVSRLQIIMTPADEPASLSDAALAKLTLKPGPELTRLTYQSPDDGWQCQYDRRWYLHYDRPKNSVVKLRLVDSGAPAGQCIASTLPDRDPAKLVALDEFQEDVRRALGKNFGEFVEAGQSTSPSNCRIYRVAAQGTSSDVPMRWVYYLVSDPRGRQVALTFAVEQKMVERFADADKAMVGSLRFVATKEEKISPEGAEKITRKEPRMNTEEQR